MSEDVNARFEWVPGMREISGFGGGYEAACRRMLVAGVAWLEANPGAELVFRDYRKDIKNSAAADDFENAVMNAEPDCSGAMHGAACSHALFVHRSGWDAYVAKMSEARP